jgi:signal transduction histidine kinase
MPASGKKDLRLKKKNDDLHNLLQQKDFELSIEAALEKVRTVAMAMKEPADMLKICRSIASQLKILGIDEIRNVQTAIIYEQKGTYLNYEFYSRHHKDFITEVHYDNHPMSNAFVMQMLSGPEGFFSKTLKKKEVQEWFAFQKTTNQFADKFLEKANSLSYYWYSLGPVALGISTYKPLSKAEQKLFRRFRNVFSLAYKRFEDIESAESRAREARIDVSLERVRSGAMAMQSSEGLSQIIQTLYTEFNSLDFSLDRVFIMTFDPEVKGATWWIGSQEAGANAKGYFVQMHDQLPNLALWQGWNKGDEKWQYHLRGEEKKTWDKFLFYKTELCDLPAPAKEYMQSAKDAYLCASFVHFGGLITASVNDFLKDEEFDILQRFAKVFDLAYTRFNDLKQAETRTRDAQIELALERVRARTMAMHSSSELAEVATLLFEQAKYLGIKSYASGFNIWDKEHINLFSWMSNPTGSLNPPFEMPIHIYEQHQRQYDSWKRKELFLEDDLAGDALKRHYEFLWSFPLLEKAFRKSEAAGIKTPDRQVHNAAFFSQGYLLFITEDPCPQFHAIFKSFAKVFDQTYTRFLDLQKAEEQTREAQIQLSLERVRARTMAMFKSNELLEIASQIFDQLKVLGAASEKAFFGFGIFDEVNETMTMYNTGFAGVQLSESYTVPIKGFAMSEKLYAAWSELPPGNRKQHHHEEHLSPDQAIAFISYVASTSLKESPSVKELLGLIKSGEFAKRYPVWSIYDPFFSHGYLTFHDEKPLNSEQLKILRRFASVFEQSYTRFLDLQKAETQAREANIETALERVRSRAMAMHTSLELQDVVRELRKQMGLLDQKHLETCVIQLYEESPDFIQSWAAVRLPDSEREMREFHAPLPKKGLRIMEEALQAYSSGRMDYVLVNEGPKLQEWIRWMKEEFPEAHQFIFEDPGMHLKARFFWSFADFQGGALQMVTWTEPNEETRKLLRRFANVFGLAYRRFSDLKKAEAQTRESQIQLALERVRARTMAMQHSDELSEAVYILFQQFRELGENPDQATIGIVNEAERVIEYWVTMYGKQMDRVFKFSIDEPHVTRKIFDSWKNQEKSLVIDLSGKALEEFTTYRAGMGGAAIKPDEKRRIINVAFFSKGLLNVQSNETRSGESIRLLERFAGVFDQTYTRFLDLQKAEAQAREAHIETALERVRSRTLAMQNSDELAETASVLFKQLIQLGIEPNRLYIAVIKDNRGDAEFWITDEDGTKVSRSFSLNLNDNKTFHTIYQGWKQEKRSLVVDVQGEELKEYFEYLTAANVPFKDGLSQKRRIQHIAYFSNGYIGMASPDDQPVSTLQLLERFAYVLNLTFTRFNDLKIAEAHALQAEQDLIEIKAAKKKAEDTLSELQLTQKQLIQSEKMASLGELTAGIAHEIQNPLNFVNNFSEVSNELLDEMNEELIKGDLNEAKAIAENIKQNLDKINHHGKRADGIVKAMLQHSRAGSGQKELTDINSLCDEYLRLAYHGLRAKEKSFNAKIETEFDAGIGKINIVPQDIGRVLLNLINNAFYAVREKRKLSDNGYMPSVTISTRQDNQQIFISVRDNGQGIPAQNIDKVFQPFFSTKPTGQGTGLGLSLSYDIVQAHGGDIKLETNEGEGCLFIVQLPAQV